MKNEQIEISVRNTLNAIIAGGHLTNLFYADHESPIGVTLDTDTLAELERQLREYYSQSAQSPEVLARQL